MSTPLHTTVDNLIDKIAQGTERVREIVVSGDLHELEVVLGSRGEHIELLGRTMSEVFPPEGGEIDDLLASRLEELREADRRLTEWMMAQKEEVAMALASLRRQDRDPYAEDTFVGPALLNQTT